MVHQDVEKKGQLLTRFIVESLYGYADRVRENLSVYLNTAEKIRVRISRNSLTLTDRTIWHNKIERVPISLIRECQVDSLSPKICYFANETVTNRYQILVVLCKSADDSFKLVNVLKHKINSQGYYRAHSRWLQNGSFSEVQEKLTPKTKHKTIASVEVASPKLGAKFGWSSSHSRSLPQAPPTPESLRSVGFWSQKLSPTMNAGNRVEEQQKDFTNVSVATSASSQSDQPVPEYAVNVHKKPAVPSLPLQPAQPRQTVDQTIKQNNHHLMGCKNIEEVKVVMRRAKNASNQKAAVDRSRVCVREDMKSTIVQYESDDEDNEKTEAHLQRNSNGIARVVVGGNDSETVLSNTGMDNAEKLIAKDGIARCEAAETDRTSGDGANSADLKSDNDKSMLPENIMENTPATEEFKDKSITGNKVIDQAATTNKISDNSVEGIYDNMRASEEAAEEVPKSSAVSSKPTIQAARNEHSAAFSPEQGSDEQGSDDEDYQLVLTDLKLLTSGFRPDGIVEPRYPHQIIAAQSLSQLNNSMSVSQLSAKTYTKPVESPVLTEPQASTSHIQPIPLRTDSNGQGRCVPKQQEPLARPQSTASGLHLIRGNDLRRSARRTGQYKSIAEYEKMQGNACDMFKEKKRRSNIENMNSINQNRNSVLDNTASNFKEASKTPSSPKHDLFLHRQPLKNSTKVADKATKVNHDPSKNSISVEPRLSNDKEISNRRASLLSITSGPNNVVLRRVRSSSNSVHNHMKKESVKKEKSKSLDRKSCQQPVGKRFDEGVNPNGLTLVGSRASLVSSARMESPSRPLSKKPNALKCIDEQRRSSGMSMIESHKTVSLKPNIQRSSLSQYKKKSHPNTQFRALPTTPEWSLSQQASARKSQNDLTANAWEQNPGFKRFFDSILLYGPEANISKTKIINQPDIVLESLAADSYTPAENSDSESSIRSSASAYWPPELKQQTNFSDDFEEAASWKFHSPMGKRQTVHVS
ncbi:uncharacterized protein [Watersipora subatra]|uniref:uncharacterized protein isoform X1 n=1 Tax=Watersipora subatra TaxID=2589382 RepID=UPI00355B8A1F